MRGCNSCPARSKCAGLTYRGSECAALRHRYGAPGDPEIHEGVDDLISRKALAETAKNMSSGLLNEADTLGVLDLIYRQPAVDPHKHGRWIGNKNNPVDMVGDGFPARECYCSECGDWLSASDEYLVRGRYCPNCGAMMDGGEKQ